MFDDHAPAPVSADRLELCGDDGRKCDWEPPISLGLHHELAKKSQLNQTRRRFQNSSIEPIRSCRYPRPDE